MKNFLNKEIKLCLAPINIVYLIMASMTLIPGYPRYVPFFFLCVSTFQIFNNASLNKDMEYSMILPITKKEIVKSRCLLVAVYEIVFTLLTIPFSIAFFPLTKNIAPEGNLAGIEANVAFYGLALILISVNHFIFFTMYYKKANKAFVPFIVSAIVFWVLYIILEMPIWLNNVLNIEYFKVLDKFDGPSLIKQVPVLIVGILFFFLSWIATYKISAKKFEKVDL